jgi:hypothetical protein
VTPAEVDQLARIVADGALSYDRLMVDRDERLAAARFGIVQLLLTSHQEPGRDALLAAGRAEVTASRVEARKARGYTHRRAGHSLGFVKYWAPEPVAFEDSAVARVALPQILAALTPTRRAALLALAEHDGDYRAAAASLSISYERFAGRLWWARRDARARWYGSEPTPPPWRSPLRQHSPETRRMADRLRTRRRRRQAER